MQFDHRGTGSPRRLDLLFVRIDEQRHANPAVLQSCYRITHHIQVASHLQPPFRGQFCPVLRHQAAVRGFQAPGDCDHFRRVRHLEIQAGLHSQQQGRRIAIDDMATILAQVHRDAVGAGLLGDQRSMHRVGMPGATRLANSSNVIHVDAQGDCAMAPARRIAHWLARCMFIIDLATMRDFRLRPSRHRVRA